MLSSSVHCHVAFVLVNITVSLHCNIYSRFLVHCLSPFTTVTILDYFKVKRKLALQDEYIYCFLSPAHMVVRALFQNFCYSCNKTSRAHGVEDEGVC